MISTPLISWERQVTTSGTSLGGLHATPTSIAVIALVDIMTLCMSKRPLLTLILWLQPADPDVPSPTWWLTDHVLRFSGWLSAERLNMIPFHACAYVLIQT